MSGIKYINICYSNGPGDLSGDVIISKNQNNVFCLL